MVVCGHEASTRPVCVHEGVGCGCLECEKAEICENVPTGVVKILILIERKAGFRPGDRISVGILSAANDDVHDRSINKIRNEVSRRINSALRRKQIQRFCKKCQKVGEKEFHWTVETHLVTEGANWSCTELATEGQN